jgi:hypothetical protein
MARRRSVKVKNLFIISVEADAQIKGSARGFLYKYMLNNNAENIFVYEFNAEIAIATLQTSAKKEDGGGWVLISSPAPESNDEEAESDEYINPFTTFAKENLTGVNENQAASAKQYRLSHQNGAIIACHASSMALCNIEPELFAQNLIVCTKKPGNEVNGIFPVFDKIVFNACNAAKIFEKAAEVKQNTNFWTSDKKKIGNGKKAQEINVARFKQNGVDETGELTLSAHLQEIELRQNFFNPVFRFLNIYGRYFNKNIIVAGYDQALTAADLSKQLVDNGKLTALEKLKVSGRKMLLENASTKPLGWVGGNGVAPKHKFFYKFTAAEGNVNNATIVPVEWSEWTDQKTG